MKRRFGLVVAMMLILPLFGTSHASAATSKAMFEWIAENNVAMADNGDTVEIDAEGMMDVGAKMAEGGGTFTHFSSGGAPVATGEITATGLQSFQFYGCGLPGFPDFCGGRALISVHLEATVGGTVVEADGTLTVDCLIGSPPAGADEGVRLNVKDLINFNMEVSGETLFVLLSE